MPHNEKMCPRCVQLRKLMRTAQTNRQLDNLRSAWNAHLRRAHKAKPA